MIVLDRYEGDFAVLETPQGQKNVPRDMLESGISEGSVLLFKDGKYCLDAETTASRKAMLQGLQDTLFE